MEVKLTPLSILETIASQYSKKDEISFIYEDKYWTFATDLGAIGIKDLKDGRWKIDYFSINPILKEDIENWGEEKITAQYLLNIVKNCSEGYSPLSNFGDILEEKEAIGVTSCLVTKILGKEQILYN